MAVTPLKIGVDFGGVLSFHDKHRYHGKDEDDEATVGEHYSTDINIPDALSTLIKLRQLGHQLYLISFCGRMRAHETRESLQRAIPNNDLFTRVYFVRRKSYKVDVCRSLGCDVMIDDTRNILNNIHSIVPTMKLLWFTSSTNIPAHHKISNIIEVNSWVDIDKTIAEIAEQQTLRHKSDSRVTLDDKIYDV